MEKINPGTQDITQENIARIIEMFPSVATEVADGEGVTQRAVDFDALREMLGDVAEGQRERYQFTWPGKREAKLLARTPSTKTMRPERDKSVNWDTTENLYIEGDNLEALKLMRETYAGKIKLIYIDPPYNTGHDFIYNDHFAQTQEDYEGVSGDFDDEGGRLVANPESNGRYHSDWCSMMYPRLLLARDLLTEDGVIFISIDGNEAVNLTRLCDDVFGEANRIGVVSRVTKTASNNGTYLAPTLDYIICCAKHITKANGFKDKVNESLYKKIEKDGPRKGEKYRDDVALYQAALNDLRPNQKYFIECPDGSKVIPPCSVLDETMREGDGRWRWTKEKYLQSKDLLVFKKTSSSPLLDENGNKAQYNIYTKSYLSDRETSGSLPRELWQDFINRKGADYLKQLGIPFDFSKPHELIKYIIEIINADKDIIIADFFSGSATTAEAVMRKNAEDNGTRKYIMVQLPELCDEKSEAKKVGFNNVCEIGEERIRRAGAKICAEVEEENRQLKLGEEPKALPDVGFRVLRIDSSNFKDTHSEPGAVEQADLFDLVDNLEQGRSGEDLLFQVLPAFRIPYSARIEEFEIEGTRCFDVNGGQLIACFDEQVGTDVIEKIAQKKPIYAVFRDASLADDSAAANFEELFRTYSPDTIRRVI